MPGLKLNFSRWRNIYNVQNIKIPKFLLINLKTIAKMNIDQLYEVLKKAKSTAENVIAENEMNQEIGDPDAYPRGIVLSDDNSDEILIGMQKLSQVFPWINFIKRNRNLYITLENETNKNYILLSARSAVVSILMDNGIDCYLDVSYHG